MSMSKLPVFVHTEKTAGGAVAEYFGFEKGVKTPSENACVDVTYYGQHGKQLRIFLKTEDDRALITLRDPADRAVSAFNWKRTKPVGIMKKIYHWNVSNVWDMWDMFNVAESFNQPLHAPWYQDGMHEESESE